MSAGHRDEAAFLLTSKHPNSFCTENDVAIYLPLNSIEEAYESMEAFYEDLCNLVLNNDEELMIKFEKISRGKSVIEEVASDIEIKPGLFGITINLKNILRKINKT